MDLKELLITWGGWVLAVVLGGIKILEYFKDRPRIRVTVKGNYRAFPQNTPYGDATLLIITATNISHHPVTLKTAALLTPRNLKTAKYLLCADSVSNALSAVELKEGQFREYIMDEDRLKKDSNLTSNKYIACVIDSTGKHWWSHNWLIRLIKLGRIK